MGASGAGTSTLAQSLSLETGWPHFDTDSYYWHASDPPFQFKREVSERIDLMNRDFAGLQDWTLSGSLVSWGGPLLPLFDLVVYLYVPPEERMRRLALRELQRYGGSIDPGGEMHRQHLEFMEWAAGYDQSQLTGRNRKVHEAWLLTLDCPVLRIEGTGTVQESLEVVMSRLTGGTVQSP